MKSTIELLDQAKGNNSDAVLARELGLSHQAAINMWRKRGHISAFYTAKLAELLNIDVKEALAVCAAEAEQNPEGREYLFKRLQGGLVQSALLYPILILGALGAFILC